MRAASSIWFAVPNNHQADHCSHLADDRQPTYKPPKASEELKPVHKPDYPEYYRYRSQSQTDLVDGYTRLVTDRINDGWSCHLMTILFSQLWADTMSWIMPDDKFKEYEAARGALCDLFRNHHK